MKFLLESAFQGTPLGERFRELKIWGAWENIVGTAVASRTRPLRISAGQLTVSVASAPWMQQLSFMKSDLRQRINEFLGEEIVKEIVLKSGRLAETIENQGDELPVPREISQEHRSLIQKNLSQTDEVELRELLGRLMESHYRRGRGC